MLFLMRLGEGEVDEAQVEAAISDFPSLRRAAAGQSPDAVNSAPDLLVDERRKLRPRIALALVAIVVLACGSLLADSQGGFFSPAEVLACYDLAFQQFVASVVAPSDLLGEAEVLSMHGAYFCVLDAIGATLAAVLGGAALCVGGLLLQSSFRREYAVVPITGVSAAVLVCQGIALLVIGATLGISWVALVVACVVGLAPVVVLRFRFNGLNLPAGVARQLGIDLAALRRLADGCAVVLLVASQFPLAIVVPPLARRLFGAEFRHALVGTALLGIAAMLLVRLIPVPAWIPACAIAAALVIWQRARC